MPVYYYRASGQMKTFLDCMNPLYGRKRAKKQVYIVKAMDDDLAQMDRPMDALLGWADCFNNMEVGFRIYVGCANDRVEGF